MAFQFYALITVVVIFTYLISFWATSMTVSSKSSAYNTYIGRSRYEPPGIVFGIVWFIIFTGTLWWWLYLVGKLEEAGRTDLINKVQFYFFVIVLLLILWSLLVVAGELSGETNIYLFHLLSTVVLIFSALFVVYTYFIFRDIFFSCSSNLTCRPSRRVEVLMTIYFIIFGGWLFAASGLSIDMAVQKWKNI